MVIARSEITVDSGPDDLVKLVLDQRFYAGFDDKMGRIDWVRDEGDITIVKYRPRLPGFKIPEPKVTAHLFRRGPGRLDVRLASLPRNFFHHLVGRYSGSFEFCPQGGGTRVTREVRYELRPFVRWAVERRLRLALGASVRKELAGLRAAVETSKSGAARVVVVGAGPSGIATAVKLREQGITDVIILEKADGVGGTWRQNTYPGCAVDIPSPLYSFSFQPNPGWTRLFAGQREILDYIERVVDTHGLRRSLRTGVELLEARWDHEKRQWDLETTDGRYIAEHVVFAAGLLHAPAKPAVQGLETFPGAVFHSAQWDHSTDIAGKRVAIIGTGCSGVQLLPPMARLAGKVYVLQRTPGWVLPRPDIAVPVAMRRLLAANPWLLSVARGAVQAALAAAAFVIQDVRRARALTPLARWWLRHQISDITLRSQVTPTFTVGCKRLILSNDYYAALQQPNVELIPRGLASVRGPILEASDGTACEADIIIFASGFELRRPPIAGRIRGRDGRRLSEEWQDESPRAYRGTTIPSFPNAYFMLGPNSVMYNSLLEVAEFQSSYVASAIKAAKKTPSRVLEVRLEAFTSYNRKLQHDIGATAYNRGGCQSIYLDEKGTNFVTYPWSALKMRQGLRKFDRRNYWAPPMTDVHPKSDEPAA